MSREHGRRSPFVSSDACRGCGQEITTSALTDSYLNAFGSEDDGRALVYVHDKYLHLHNVVIMPIGTDTVRWALRRYWMRRWLRLRYHSLPPSADPS